jgi:hypothetical protein
VSTSPSAHTRGKGGPEKARTLTLSAIKMGFWVRTLASPKFAHLTVAIPQLLRPEEPLRHGVKVLEVLPLPSCWSDSWRG